MIKTAVHSMSYGGESSIPSALTMKEMFFRWLPEPAVATEERRTTPVQREPGSTEDRMIADAAVGGLASNAMTLANYSREMFGEVSILDCALALKESASALTRGDLTAAESMLASQAVALNAIFGELARRASLNMGQSIELTERHLRLGLKAQGQCRATLETLAAIKNPPIVFARQANIANGPQQVNNGVPGSAASRHAYAQETQSEPNRLLEDADGKRLDGTTQSATGGTHPDMAPLGTRDRTEEHSG